MFIEQAVQQFETWTNESAPRSVMLKAALEALGAGGTIVSMKDSSSSAITRRDLAAAVRAIPLLARLRQPHNSEQRQPDELAAARQQMQRTAEQLAEIQSPDSDGAQLRFHP